MTTTMASKRPSLSFLTEFLSSTALGWYSTAALLVIAAVPTLAAWLLVVT
jgi:hypothetical protein